MHDSKNIHIHGPGEGSLSEVDRAKLSRSLAKGLVERPEQISGGVRDMLRSVVMDVRKTGKGKEQKYLEFERDGHLITATVDGETAGAVGYNLFREGLAGNPPVCEIGSVSVLKEFRGLHLSSRLMDEALVAVRKDFPDADVMLSTKEDRVRSWCAKNSFQELTEDELAQFWDLQDEEGKGHLAKWMAKGWRTYKRSSLA